MAAQTPLLYHLGCRRIAKTSLARVNENQPHELFEALFSKLFERCRALMPKHKFRFKNPLYSLDSTLIDLSIHLFPWSDINGCNKGAMKLHVGLNHAGYIPEFVSMTDGKMADLKAARYFDFPKGSVIAMDKGYTSFDLYKRLNDKGLFFVTRLRCDVKYSVIDRRNVTHLPAINADQTIQLNGEKGRRFADLPLRRVTYKDPETGQGYEFLTNHFGLSAATIAAIYKDRWQVELFFKHIKQNLKIKSFLGNSKNAIMTQVWIAMCVHLLVVFLKWSAKLSWSIQRIMRVLGLNLFVKRDILGLLGKYPDGPFEVPRQGCLPI